MSTTVKVHIPGKSIHGISRVVEAQRKYLPEFGIELVDNINEADVVNTHGADRVPVETQQPILNTNHGLYWSRYPWGANYQEVNCMVIDAMVQAKAHTVPSEWVATSVRRGGLFYPEVVYHGIDADEWQIPEKAGKYILWNKARADFVSNPRDMNILADMVHHHEFISTLGKSTTNVNVIGEQSFEDMKKLVSEAGLYLCTARETFGIGTLEAMACGVPIVGWAWGGQKEIVRQGETGYLTHPGDYTGLAGMIEVAFAERDRLSKNCIEDVRENWTWRPRIKQYADIMKRLHMFYNVQTRPKVSVIVTAYNLDQYLPQCLESVKNQTIDDWECLVVDDALSETTQQIVSSYEQRDERFKYLRPDQNLGLPAARNFGFFRAKGLYIRHLDADDWLHEDALRKELLGMENDNSISIGYAPMQNVDADGNLMYDGDNQPQVWADHDFSWRYQMSHINQIPSCCMVKREVFDRSGGYRTRMKKAEDAHFWCLVTSNGFRAKKVANTVTMYHRVHPESKGQKEWDRDGTDGDWTAWFAYRFGAGSYAEGRNLVRQLGMNVPHPELVPFSVDAPPPPGKTCWDVHDYSYPVVSVIVTVGPGYEKYLQDCLDGVASQTYPDWECIVVNDTGQRWPPAYWDNPLKGYPWAIEVDTGGNHGVSRARNLGAEKAQGQLLVWLDADDYWLPWFLERMVAMYEANDGIIYPDVLFQEPGKPLEDKPYREFKCKDIIHQGMYPGTSVLVPRWVHDKIVEYQGGWDEQIPGMEDWDYQLCAHAITEVCAYHLEEPLFIYRYRPDGNREKHQKRIKEIVAYMDRKWAEYRVGGKEVMCGCKSKTIKKIPESMMQSTGFVQTAQAQNVPVQEVTVDLKYMGNAAKVTYRGKVTGTTYKFGILPNYEVKRVFALDAREFLKMNERGKPLFTLFDEQATVTQDVRQFLEEL